MKMRDEISPLVNIIFLIFYKIGWFMVIFAVAIVAFATAFFLIG